MLQRHSVEILHDDEVLTFALVNLEDHADVGMIEGGCSLRLTLEAGQSLRIFGNLVRQELQGDKAVQLYVLGLVDHTHPATAEFLDNAIVRDSLADHWADILGLQGRQVNEGGRGGGVSGRGWREIPWRL